jgi:AcrR family transcriptional regulator
MIEQKKGGFIMKQAFSTKESIMESAVYLFNVKGYSGSSVRDIAKRANVNPANISYYFNGKQGLLEECLVYFFENYLLLIEKETMLIEEDSVTECLLRAVRSILNYQTEYHLLAGLAWREVSIDSQTIREVIASYLTKEKYLWKLFLKKGVQSGEFNKIPMDYFIIQMKAMLTMPYLSSQYIREVWHILPQEAYFARIYGLQLEDWVQSILLKKVLPPYL